MAKFYNVTVQEQYRDRPKYIVHVIAVLVSSFYKHQYEINFGTNHRLSLRNGIDFQMFNFYMFMDILATTNWWN